MDIETILIQMLLHTGFGSVCIMIGMIRKRQEMGYTKKEKLSEALLQAAAAPPALYISGAAGIGKTRALKNYKNHMTAQGKSVCYLDMEADAQRKALWEKLDSENGIEETVILIDHLSESRDTAILQLLSKKLLSAETENDRQVILASRTVLPKELYPCVQKGRIHVLEGTGSFYDEKELLALLGQIQVNVTYKQVRALLEWSGGWPAIVEIALAVIRQQGTMEVLPQISDHPMIQQFVREEIWENLTLQQQSLCLKLAILPQIPIHLFTGEAVWIRRQLLGLCILKEQEQGADTFPPFFREFLLAESADRGEDVTVLSQAGGWFQEKGMYREALDCFYRAKDPISHRNCMLAGYETIFWEIGDHSLLKKYVKFSMEETEEAKKIGLFLKAMIWLDVGKFDRVKDALHVLKESFSNTKNPQDGLLYINLLYDDPKVSILDWMEEALSVAAITGGIHIYGLTDTALSCLSGRKDLSVLFCRKKKEIEQFKNQWNRIFEEEQRDFFCLAEIEYLMETNRQEEALELLIPYLVIQEEEKEGQKYQAVLFGMLCRFSMISELLTGYEELIDGYYNRLLCTGNVWEKRNIVVQKTIYNVWKKKLTLYPDFMEDDREDYIPVSSKNCFYLLQKARYYLFLQKYEKGYMLFGRLCRYYNTYRQYLYQVECALGQAVAAYGMNRGAEALKRMAAALAQAECYRYVGVFCLFGTAGKNLLENYLGIVMNHGGDLSKSRRKTYYYGNVVGTSAENYMNVLMRAAKDSMSRYPFAQSEGADKGDTLTMTEISILQYIEQGYTNARIAVQMNIKEATVKKHVYNIFKKLEVKTRVQAIQKGKQIGILAR